MVSRWYGAPASQMVVSLAALALAGYAVLRLVHDPGWPRILVWFLAAVVGHDLVLFPLYAAADGVLVRAVSRFGAVNYLRVPTLAAGLTLLLFLPGIIRQGAPSYHAATGLTQQPFLVRWLALAAGFFAVSAVVWLARRPWTRGRGGARHRAAPVGFGRRGSARVRFGRRGSVPVRFGRRRSARAVSRRRSLGEAGP